MGGVNYSINETPTEQVIAAAAQEHVVTDSAGRVFKLRKPGVLAQFRLVEALGGETASNPVYMGMVFPLIFVAEISGDPVATPTTKRQVEALIQRLDTDGVNFVAQKVEELFGQQTPDEDKNRLKK